MKVELKRRSKPADIDDLLRISKNKHPFFSLYEKTKGALIKAA